MSDGLRILSDRGVSDAVRIRRGYRRYPAGAGKDEIPELAAHERYLKRYTIGPGWLMPKYPVMDGLPPIRPQLRPDKAVEHEPWTHRHSDMKRQELKSHLASKKRAKEHEGVGPTDEHVHTESSKYVLGPGGDDAKRLDRNPLTDFAQSGRVFFVIEGTPKNDALVSCGEKAFNVPAVAQWDAPELPAFARAHLMGEQVFVVPDSDWHENSEVIFYAVCAREYLRRINVDAHIAAPPPRARPDTEGSRKQGVDDFLGPKGSPARRHSPDQLLILSRDIDEEAFAEWWTRYEARRREEGTYAKTLKLDEAVLRMLILTSKNGLTLRGVESLTKAVLGEPRARGPRRTLEQVEMEGQWLSETQVRGKERWAKEVFRVYRACVRLSEKRAFKTTGRYPAWMDAGWERRDGKLVRRAAGPRAVPEIKLHPDLRLIEHEGVPLGRLKMQVEEKHGSSVR